MTGLPAAEPGKYRRGVRALHETLDRTLAQALKPPPKLTLSQWAERYAYLSPETSAETGKFKSFRYQDGIMDAVTDPVVSEITVMKSARVGYTKILDHAVGYFIHQDPSPVLVVQPRVEDAEDYSKTEIAPMLRDTPVLAEIVGDVKAKDSGNTILKKAFRNGASLTLVGANSPGGFRRITVRVVAFDEIDGYPVQGAGSEGDQIALGTKRSETFWNRKIIKGSTPTVKGVSRIEKSWEKSDQRRYHVPCPHCKAKQPLIWAGLRWDEGKPETAHYVCQVNGCIIDESHKPWMIDNGEWIASRPFAGHAGFHIWAGYSLFPNAAWSKIAAEFLLVKDDPQQLQTFVNLVLGETWEEDQERVDGAGLMDRAEDFGPDAAPDGVLVVTCGVDVQDDRLEVERIGWGAEEESWSLEYRVIYGDPSSPQLWADLDAYLQEPTRTRDGRSLPVSAACVDSGGHHTQAVYKFCRERTRRRIWAIKGMAGPGRPVFVRSKTKAKGTTLYLVGVDAAKDSIYARLKIHQPGPGYCHFPAGRDVAWYEQLTAEGVVTKYVKGFPTRVYQKKPGARNEALDCRVYGYAALQSLTIRWARLIEERDRWKAPAPEPVQEQQQAPAPPAGVVASTPARKPSGWLGGRRGGWLR